MASPSLGNVTFPAFRSGLNDILQALDTLNAGSTAPTEYEAYTLWLDTGLSTPILKIRNAANSAWIELARLLAPVSAVSGTDIDCRLSDYFTKTISSNTTFTFSNPPSGMAYGFILELTLTGAPTATFPASVDWPGGSAPTLASGSKNLIGFITRDGGTTWYGNALTDFS